MLEPGHSPGERRLMWRTRASAAAMGNERAGIPGAGDGREGRRGSKGGGGGGRELENKFRKVELPGNSGGGESSLNSPKF